MNNSNRIFRYTQEDMPLAIFEDISAIPRASGKEERISEYLLNRALERGLEASCDETNNVIIKKKASPGYEDCEPVMLQAHMNMVCEKLPDSEHDFDKDPIHLIVDGDILHADGTTLGADDGIGVALAMAVLESDDIKHPPIEVLFTTEEESTFLGVASVDGAMFEARRVINLDFAEEDRVVVGSCGGTGMKVRLLIQREEIVKENGKA